jgi:hypothetical protein
VHMRMPAADEHQVLLYRPALLHRRHYAQSGPATVVCAPRYCVNRLSMARIGSTRRRDSGRRTKPYASQNAAACSLMHVGAGNGRSAALSRADFRKSLESDCGFPIYKNLADCVRSRTERIPAWRRMR